MRKKLRKQVSKFSKTLGYEVNPEQDVRHSLVSEIVSNVGLSKDEQLRRLKAVVLKRVRGVL